MAVQHMTHVFDVNDFMVWPMTADPGNASPTYGSAIDVPGIADVSMDPDLVSAVLKGDAQILDRKGRLDGFTMPITYGSVDIDLNQVLYGGYLAAGGTPGTTFARWGVVGGSALPVFAARFVIENVDLGVGALVCTVYKAQISGGTFLKSSSDNYGQPAAEMGVFQSNHKTRLPRQGGVLGVDFTPLIDIQLLESITDPYTVLP